MKSLEIWRRLYLQALLEVMSHTPWMKCHLWQYHLCNYHHVDPQNTPAGRKTIYVTCKRNITPSQPPVTYIAVHAREWPVCEVTDMNRWTFVYQHLFHVLQPARTIFFTWWDELLFISRLAWSHSSPCSPDFSQTDVVPTLSLIWTVSFPIPVPNMWYQNVRCWQDPPGNSWL